MAEMTDPDNATAVVYAEPLCIPKTSAFFFLHWKLSYTTVTTAVVTLIYTWNIKMIWRNSLRHQQSNIPLMLTSGKSGFRERGR